MIFSLALSRPNNANQLIRYNNQLTIVEQRFTNIAAVQNMGVLQQIWINKIYGGDITDMSKYHNVDIWRMD